MAKRLQILFCQVDDPRRIPADCGTWFVPCGHDWDAAMVADRPLIMHFIPNDEALSSVDGIRHQIECARVWCNERGLHPIAMSYGEEWYRGEGTKFDQHPVWQDRTGVALMDRKRDIVNGILAEMKRAFPSVLTVQIETFYNDVPFFGGDYYYAPVYDCDVLAIDAYFTGKGSPYWQTDGLALEPGASKHKFDMEIGRLFTYAADQYKRPILMIAQAFKHDGAAPNAEQLRWFFDLVQQVPQVQALAYFARFSLNDSITALDKLPGLLPEVQWQYEQSGGQFQV